MPLPTPTSMQGALGSDGRWNPLELELLEKLVNYDQGKHLGLHFSLRNILRMWNERYLWTKHGTMSPSLMVLSQVLQRPKCRGPFPSKQRRTHDNNKYISSMILEVPLFRYQLINDQRIFENMVYSTLCVIADHCHSEVDLLRVEVWGGADGVKTWLQ